MKTLMQFTTFLASCVFSLAIHGESFLLKNATLYTASDQGILQNSDLLLSNGKILRIGKNLKPLEQTQVIDASNKHITPGLINAHTSMGLVEIAAVAATVDARAELGAAFNIAPAINFRSTLVPQNRINGLTRAIVMPAVSDSLFAGQAAAIALHSNAKGLLSKQVAQLAVYGDSGAEIAGGSRAAAMHLLNQAFTDAAYLKANQQKYAPGYPWHFSLSINDLKALFPVLEQKIPLVVYANRADDIVNLIAFAKDHNIKIIIAGGGEAWTVAQQLVEAKVPVIIDPMENLPQFESLAVRFEGAARLHQTGVKVLLTGGGSHNAYLVRQSAGNAVAYGLPVNAAIAAMSINTAEAFGINNYGELTVGMDADIVVWDGDPLELSSNPDQVFIQGKQQKMVSRATRLRDRYWDLSKQNFLR